MKHMKAIMLLFVSLTLLCIATNVINAQDEYYDDWSSYDDVAFWGMFTGALCIIPAIVFIIGIVIAIWVYKDAERRGSSGALWLVIVIIYKSAINKKFSHSIVIIFQIPEYFVIPFCK